MEVRKEAFHQDIKISNNNMEEGEITFMQKCFPALMQEARKMARDHATNMLNEEVSDKKSSQ